MKENIVYEKALCFSVRMIKLANFLQENKQRVIADQIMRSGTSIGANISESEYAASKADFINKLKIAEKEANETVYWLRVMKQGMIIKPEQFESLYTDISEIQRLIASSIKTSKKFEEGLQ